MNSNATKPLASVITVVYNGESGIEQTMHSVFALKSDDIEYIIIDGGSTDRTTEIIRRHAGLVDDWISEKDQGIYDAINKGVQRSHGNFFYVLNVGDILVRFPREELSDALSKEADVALFPVMLSDGRTHVSRIDYRTRFANTIHHQGAFYRTSLDIRYDTRLKVFADFDQNQKLYKGRSRFMTYPKAICHHSLDGISNNRKFRSEYYEVIRNNFGVLWEGIGRLYLWQGEWRAAVKKTFSKGKPA